MESLVTAQAYLETARAYLAVALGLGFVIFIHELGHFVLAKWAGVKVLKFSLGFGPALAKFQHGETLYAIRVLPLGGSVQMLGEPMEEGGETETEAGVKVEDPRAFKNKPVGARMAIISAGVLMNLVLGWACFTYVATQPGVEMPAVIGPVDGRLPAYRAGLRSGDEVVAIDGKRDVSYRDLIRTVALSGQGRVVNFEIKRPGVEETFVLPIMPERAVDHDKPVIGVNPMSSLLLYQTTPFVATPGLDGSPKTIVGQGGFQGGDRVLAVGPADGPRQAVKTRRELDLLLAKYRDRPVDVEVERGGGKGEAKGAAPGRAVVRVPPHRFLDFGLRMAMGPVVAVQKGSPAESAGFLPGDRIVKVDGRSDFDPIRLPDELQDKAGRAVTFEVVRTQAGGGSKTAALTATPTDMPTWTEMPLLNEPVDLPGLGLTYDVPARVVAVRPGSPAEKARIKPGDTIRSVTIPDVDPSTAKAEPETYTFDAQHPRWPSVFNTVQNLSTPQILITLGDSESPISIRPEPVAGWYLPSRGMQFTALTQTTKPLGPALAARVGTEQVLDVMTQVYETIRGLIQRRLGRGSTAGPIGIIQMAYNSARGDLVEFVEFLGMLSVNLAVINFLPIFPLDGGQMVFLIAEKVRGRPLPERGQVPIMIAGLVFVLLLIVVVSINDIARLLS